MPGSDPFNLADLAEFSVRWIDADFGSPKSLDEGIDCNKSSDKVIGSGRGLLIGEGEVDIISESIVLFVSKIDSETAEAFAGANSGSK
jgi:hypothetical protein